MSGPSFRFRVPPWWYFKFPPATEPLTLPPPSEVRTFAAPFEIPLDFYRAALDWRVPVTIALCYSVTVAFANKYNRDNGSRPWWVSKTRPFFAFVIVHNTFLAIFSAITCWGMLRALAHTWPAHREYPFLYKSWPGLRTQNGLAGAADALCHMHGPRGFGDAVYYSPDANRWLSGNRLISFAANGEPDPTDLGRLWNEGLAFYGFWFYLSKFYEVLDTLIILAKGKRSQTLQTYHHAGAMMCMWAGIRFMSPPIWMFVFINSFIHALMYTYYTLSALGVRVPQRIKRTLTTMQIMQFLIGFTFAAGHLFVTYSVPVAVPYRITSTISSVVSAATSGASSVLSEAAAATAGGQVAAWLKKVAFRAAGEEGLAENVRDNSGHAFGQGANMVEHISEIREVTKYRTEYQTIPCIDTQGQAFAIYLNLLYLAPLTWLFVRFFIRAYTRIGGANKQQPQRRRISKSAQDAAHSVGQELDDLGKAAEDRLGDVMNNFGGTLPEGGNETPNSKSNDRRRVSHAIGHIARNFETSDDQVNSTPNGSAKSGTLRKKPSEEHENLRRMFEAGDVRQRPGSSPSPDSARKPRPSTSSSIKEEIQPYADGVVEKVEEAAEAAVEKAKQAVGVGVAPDEGNAEADDTETKSVAGEDKDTTAEAAHDQAQEPDATAGAEEEPSQSQQESQPGSRASSPSLSRQSTQQRESSPRKPSRIPRATTQTRSRSPTKKSLTPQPNGTTAASRRARTPEPAHENRKHEAESFPQVRSAPSHRTSSPINGDSRTVNGKLAERIQAGDEPEFAQVVQAAAAEKSQER